jgi:hypothetical protein
MYSLLICPEKSSHGETASVVSPAGAFVARSHCVVLLCQDTGEIVSAAFVTLIFVSIVHLQPLAGAFLCVCEACVLTCISYQTHLYFLPSIADSVLIVPWRDDSSGGYVGAF